MHPGSRLLDASVLVMPLVKFAGPTDPRFLARLRCAMVEWEQVLAEGTG